jgi:hypothetical protein
MFDFNLLNKDLFDLYRFLLAWVVTIYCVVTTAQWGWGWYVWLSSSDRYIVMMRRYMLLQILRMKFREFWGELLICSLLGVAFWLMWDAQVIMGQIDKLRESANVARHVSTR